MAVNQKPAFEANVDNGTMTRAIQKTGGLAGWLLARLRRQIRPRPSLAVLEKITLAPRQSLALVEAEGRRFLIATSAEGAPAFFALDGKTGRRIGVAGRTRISW